MDDRNQIYERFAECYGATRPTDLVKAFNLDSSTVSNWKTGKRPIPRERLKKAVDEFNLGWDWLLDGKPPRSRPKRSSRGPLDNQKITQRFLDFFQGMSQTEIADCLGITPVAVHYMFENKMKVPWDKLRIAVEQFDTTWEWLLEGRGPARSSSK